MIFAHLDDEKNLFRVSVCLAVCTKYCDSNMVNVSVCFKRKERNRDETLNIVICFVCYLQTLFYALSFILNSAAFHNGIISYSKPDVIIFIRMN